MRTSELAGALLAIALVWFGAAAASGEQEGPSDAGSTVRLTCEASLPGLVPGTLRYAELADLPDGTLAVCEGHIYRDQQLDAALQSMPEKARKVFKEARILLLEQLMARDLLLAEAERRGLAPDDETQERDETAGVDSAMLTIQTLLKQVASKVSVSEEELRAAYAEHKDEFEGASYEDVRDSSLKPYLLSAKQQAEVERFIAEIGKAKGIRLDAAWAKAQYDKLTQNPVDKARKSGKPAVVDFGSTGRIPCEMMAPILKELKEEYEGKADVVVVLVNHEPVLTQRYGISTIPVQIFFDANGTEVWRHIGYLPKEKIVARLAELGVPKQ